MTEPVYISLSEIETFKRCKFKWDLSSANRQSIRHKTSPALYLSLGSAVHKALEAHALGGDAVEAAETYLVVEREARVQAYIEEHGSEPWPMELAKFDETAELAMGLVRQYVQRYGRDDTLADQGLTLIGIEVPFKIDITAEIKRRFGLNWKSIYFCGTLDGIAVDEQGNIWVVENKTYSQKPSTEDIQWHFQAMGYAVAIEWLTGLPVTGVLYNGIAKKLISEPKVLKSGLLSTDKRCATTLERYVQAIVRNGESPENPRFEDILSTLREYNEQGDTRFLYREKIFYKAEQLRAWEDDFFSVVMDMLDDPRVYRTIPYDGCGDCWFKDLCHSSHSGGDVDYILNARYTVGVYGSISEVKGVEPQSISSVEELKEYLTRV